MLCLFICCAIEWTFRFAFARPRMPRHQLSYRESINETFSGKIICEIRVGVLWLQVHWSERTRENRQCMCVPQVLIKNFLGLNSPGDNTCTKNHFGCVSTLHMDVFIRMRQTQKNHSTRARCAKPQTFQLWWISGFAFARGLNGA